MLNLDDICQAPVPFLLPNQCSSLKSNFYANRFSKKPCYKLPRIDTHIHSGAISVNFPCNKTIGA